MVLESLEEQGGLCTQRSGGGVMTSAQECRKAVCKVSRPMRKLRRWSSANTVMGKMKKRKKNWAMGEGEKNVIHKEKSQICHPLRGVLHHL